MADLTTPTRPASCCEPAAQETCCEPADKADCCGSPASGACGGSAAQARPVPESDIRRIVREHYAQAARRAAGAHGSAQVSLGCGVPTDVADLHPGETVLDLGSGGGADVLVSARRVSPGGRAIGLDMTDEMLAIARRSAAEAGAGNVDFVKGYIEDIPLPDESVDVVISNCVINLAADKRAVLRETARVLRPGGRFAVSDILADPDMDEATRADMAAYTGCIAGALTAEEFGDALASAGLVEIEIHPTHRVHRHAASAIIRARKTAA
jgi:arsenite methyltransferase